MGKKGTEKKDSKKERKEKTGKQRVGGQWQNRSCRPKLEPPQFISRPMAKTNLPSGFQNLGR